MLTKKICPQLNCSIERRIQPHGECCEICEGTDFCAQGHTCGPDAECLNLRTNYTCLCKAGYRRLTSGSSLLQHTCVDVNECADERLHNCSSISSTCVNKLGSFACSCKAGWTAVDSHRCIGECQYKIVKQLPGLGPTERHIVHTEAHCHARKRIRTSAMEIMLEREYERT